MIELKKQQRIGEITIKKIKWFQGVLRDYYVEVWANDREMIFSECNLRADEAEKLYRKKVKEFEGYNVYKRVPEQKQPNV